MSLRREEFATIQLPFHLEHWEGKRVMFRRRLYLCLSGLRVDLATRADTHDTVLAIFYFCLWV